MSGEADLDALRAEVAEQHGLDTQAVKFLTGTNLAELEASATQLAKLLGTPVRPEPERVGSLAALLANPSAAKDRRERHRVAVVTGRDQPRDPQTGRFVTSGFDAGARTPAPGGGNNPDHNQWLLGILRGHRSGGW